MSFSFQLLRSRSNFSLQYLKRLRGIVLLGMSPECPGVFYF